MSDLGIFLNHYKINKNYYLLSAFKHKIRISVQMTKNIMDFCLLLLQQF